ncbi:MAG: ribonuclease PH [Rubinisphaera brasiliensis]|uniref:Ribonuclease PH n=1 Tax=Rubinisphaera brasiliensis (strain ATCC 49424 / DSM 5305 / JCM 21570 / IAM 15109 / NBRC 103401 / IFAM 1448) TaxID=756272 RepID=F0SJS5_RUBBR|nr:MULTISPECIES: ribonuclease PH [Rubinisphaera]ADY61913.1 RNAse PH [Rubinisphaera brasiliensis DSM 5305]MBR9801725.1 ribonuclease PH [bacterium]
MRNDGRQAEQLRPIRVQRHFTGSAPGSVYIKAGRTTLLCTASVDLDVPPWKKHEENPSGWVTAEYNMLPGSTSPRKRRERTKVDGRSSEIQRLIGRSLRAVVDFAALGPRTITIDCDVLEADGGTRTLGITGGFIALVDALIWLQKQEPTCDPKKILTDTVAAISVGIVRQTPMLDLDYSEDSTAEVDLNVVMTGSGEFVEIQGTAEQKSFSRTQLDQQLGLAEKAIVELTRIQRDAFGDQWPLD